MFAANIAVVLDLRVAALPRKGVILKTERASQLTPQLKFCEVETQLIAHDKAVYDIAFAHVRSLF